jgi:lipopolysaccharide export system protein LptC
MRGGASRIFSILALGAGLALVGVFAWQLGLFKRERAIEISVAPVERPKQLSTTESQLSGFDKGNKPYRVTATKGYEDATTKSLVHMENVVSTFERPSGTTIDMTSNNALYDRKSKDMNMTGAVVLKDGDKFSAKMDAAVVNIDQQTVVSKSPVAAVLPSGTVTADSMTVTGNGERVIFKGGVKANFVTEKAQ